MMIFYFRLDPSSMAVYFFIKKTNLSFKKHTCADLFNSNTEIKRAGLSWQFFTLYLSP